MHEAANQHENHQAHQEEGGTLWSSVCATRAAFCAALLGFYYYFNADQGVARHVLADIVGWFCFRARKGRGRQWLQYHQVSFQCLDVGSKCRSSWADERRIGLVSGVRSIVMDMVRDNGLLNGSGLP